MKRQAFSQRFNRAMVEVREASGIARQFFEVQFEGEHDAVTAVTISVGAVTRRYAVTHDRSWMDAMFRDARDGVYGPPNDPWCVGGGVPGTNMRP